MKPVIKLLGGYFVGCSVSFLMNYCIVCPILDRINRKEMNMREMNNHKHNYEIGDIRTYYRELANAKVV